jgi:hypothetical protein
VFPASKVSAGHGRLTNGVRSVNGVLANIFDGICEESVIVVVQIPIISGIGRRAGATIDHLAAVVMHAAVVLLARPIRDTCRLGDIESIGAGVFEHVHGIGVGVKIGMPSVIATGTKRNTKHEEQVPHDNLLAASTDYSPNIYPLYKKVKPFYAGRQIMSRSMRTCAS